MKIAVLKQFVSVRIAVANYRHAKRCVKVLTPIIIGSVMEEIEKMYDRFFGQGLWETQYKPHIVAFTNNCIKAAQEYATSVEPAERNAEICVRCSGGAMDDVILCRHPDWFYCP